MADDAAVLPPGYSGRPLGLLMYFTADLRPVRVLNDWLVDTAAQRSLATANTYGRLVVRFAKFLSEQYRAELLGPEVRDDGDMLLRAFGAMMTSGASSPGPIKKGATRGVIASHRSALMSFYKYCVSARWLPNFPFTLRVVQTRRGLVETLAFLNGGRISDADRDGIPENQMDRFYRIGVLGLKPSGEPDPSFRGFASSQRNAAGFGLGVAMGLRHSEILHTTVFEVPDPHPDGLTPGRVAPVIAKGRRGRKVVSLSAWLEPVIAYIEGDRLSIARRATWEPKNPLYIDLAQTNAHEVTVSDGDGLVDTYKWSAVDKEHRLRLVIPGFGSPLVLLNHHSRDGAPLTNDDSLNHALHVAGDRCRALWPELDWNFKTHHLRHTFAGELSWFLANAKEAAEAFRVEYGRYPGWADALRNQDQTRIVMESLGHSSPATSNGYRKGVFWRLLLSVNADPDRNPAAKEVIA